MLYIFMQLTLRLQNVFLKNYLLLLNLSNKILKSYIGATKYIKLLSVIANFLTLQLCNRKLQDNFHLKFKKWKFVYSKYS